MLCRECTEKDSAKPREGLCMIVPPECCKNGYEFGCKAKNRPVKGKKGKDCKVYKRAKLSTYM
eukprot:2926018-Ditylum_brightwellii.AAC.1